MNQIPVKFSVAQIIYRNEGISNREILKILKEEYPLDRSIKKKIIEDYLLSLKAVGIIELTGVTADHEEELEMCYKITGYGVTRMKYITGKN